MLANDPGTAEISFIIISTCPGFVKRKVSIFQEIFGKLWIGGMNIAIS